MVKLWLSTELSEVAVGSLCNSLGGVFVQLVEVAGNVMSFS